MKYTLKTQNTVLGKDYLIHAGKSVILWKRVDHNAAEGYKKQIEDHITNIVRILEESETGG